MKKKGQAILICMILCLCCLLGGCRESVLQTVHTSVCELVENGKTYSATFYGFYYIEVEASQELTGILDPSRWTRTTEATTDTPYFSVRLPLADLDFYDGNMLCITVVQTGEQEWYISENDVSAQVHQYRIQHGIAVLPDLKDYDGIYF